MLAKIVAKQEIDMAILEDELPLKSFESTLQKSQRDFYQAIKQNRCAFILECKQRSPSEGLLCNDYDVTTLAKSYAQFADAISILTNAPFFGGSYNDLFQVSQTISKPVLCKDIIINPYQVAYARYHGADAVLLMMSVLDDKQYQACSKMAKCLNMCVLTEVINQEEIERAKQLKANVFVINHRDLHTFQLDMHRVCSLFPYLPQNCLIIAASGIDNHYQIQTLQDKVHGFLIGSSLSKSLSLDLKMRKLIFGPIKICGLTRTKDVTTAYECGASYGGIIFIPSSPRSISLELAKSLITAAPLHYIGVFANQRINEISTIAHALQLYAVQLHGNESSEYINQLRKTLPKNCEIWKAYCPLNLPIHLPHQVDKILIDNISNNQLGGTGLPFDWKMIKNHPLLPHCLLAGGLSSSNITQAQHIRTWGLDINSGVEQKPGIKDKHKLTQLFSQLKAKGG